MDTGSFAASCPTKEQGVASETHFNQLRLVAKR